MTINNSIISIFNNENIDDDGILYLLSVYFGLDFKFNNLLMTKINNLKIFERDYTTDNIIWNISLFGETITNDFVETFRKLFRNVDKTKAGDRQTVINKFKKFRANYPEYTDEDILEATKLYIDDYVSNNETTYYLQKAQYFIKKEKNPAGSRLLEYLEILKEEKETNKLYN